MYDPLVSFKLSCPRIFTLYEFVKDCQEHGVMLHITGSRYFGGVHAQSDWDFFVEDTEIVRLYLSGRGFKPTIGEGVYADTLTNDVWGDGISHIQLVSDADHKEAAQRAIKTTGALRVALECVTRPVNKRKMQQIIWNLAIEATGGV